jgi:NAD(P)-dependent dehydrogenase (short-subunit alcohol dehydrogenase family)
MKPCPDLSHLPEPVMPTLPPQQLLLGQKALVTGASSGIGHADDLRLALRVSDLLVRGARPLLLAALVCGVSALHAVAAPTTPAAPRQSQRPRLREPRARPNQHPVRSFATRTDTRA